MHIKDKIILNGLDMPDYLIITGVNHDITGNIEHDIVNIPGSKEINIRSTKKSPRSIIIDFKYRDSGFLTYEKKEEISNWIHSNNLKESKLEYSWILGSHYIVVPTGSTELTDSLRIKSFSLEFMLVNPCRIENKVRKVTGDFIYSGTESTYPNIEIQVKSSCNKIILNFSNDKTDGFIELNHSFNQGDKVNIDCKKKSVRVSGVINMPILSLDSDFPTIEKGINKYNISTENVKFNVIYNNLYR